jgi:imidazolonepropionase-like amidohydrolase
MSAASLRPFRFLLIVLLASILLASISAPVAAAEAPEELYLVNARLVDPATRQVREGNLLIREGVIVSTPATAPADFTGRTLDLRGKWVIPGLIDLHTHTYGNMDPTGLHDRPRAAGVTQRMLYAGVTALLDLFGDENELFNTREQQHSGKLGGADLFASLSCITAPGGHGTEYGVKARTVTSPEDARKAVSDLATRRPDVIKIIYEHSSGRPSIDKETLNAAVAAAKANGLRSVVHIVSWQDARDAVEAGASAITHVPEGPVPLDLISRMVAKNVASIPTLTVHTEYFDFVDKPEVLDAPLARAVTTPAVIAAYRSRDALARANEFRARHDAYAAVVLASVRAMSKGGVKILAGTDSGSTGTLQGYSVHRELIKLVAAGLTPWEALSAATTDAAAFLDRKYGVVPGSEASLLVLDASPIEDIHNTQRIAYVIHHGAIVDREKLIASGLAGLRPHAADLPRTSQ